MTALLKGKKGLITGIINDQSIAWAIAEFLKHHGAELLITYRAETLKKRVLPLAEQLNCDFVHELDVTNEESMDTLFSKVKEKWGSLDFILHSVAYSDKNELRGKYLDTSLNNFLHTMHTSCYSLVSLAKYASNIMNTDGSILTLSYYGANKVVSNYNVMGVAKAALESSVRYLAYDLGPQNIRVNAISAGPVRTLSSSVIGDFRSMLNSHAQTSPLKRNTTHKDIAKSALYLLSNLSSGTTGEIHYVDAGYNKVGMPNPKNIT